MNWVRLIKFAFCFLALCRCSPGQKEAGHDPMIDVVPTENNSEEDTAALRTKAEILYGSKDYENALLLIDRLLQLDSNNAKLTYRKAFCLTQLVRDQEAVEYYQKSVALGYRVFDSYFTLGMIYAVGLDNDSIAVEYFDKCLELQPNNRKVRQLREQLLRAAKRNETQL